MRHAIRILALAAIVYAVACGGDAGVDEPYCNLSLVVTPSQPVRGNTVELGVNVETYLVSGIEEFSWNVSYGGAPVSFEASGEEITFVAAQAGVYQLGVSGSVGGVPCGADGRDLNVIEEGALFEPMRLVIVPRDGTPMPPQTLDFELPGGADYTLSTLTLEAGTEINGTVRGPDDEPLAAYLRSVPFDGGQETWVERFTGADGVYSMRLQSGAQNLLVVPEGGVAPLYIPSTAADDYQGSISLPSSITVTGQVLDGAGDPVAGARVQLVVANSPSTIGVTDAGGDFTLQARAGEPVEVSVVPSEASGLPVLELTDAAGIGGGSTVAVQYDSGLDLRTVSPVLRQTDGTTPAAQARVTFIARSITGAGSISIDGVPLTATGTLTRSAQANGSGVIPDQLLTAAVYDLIVEPGPAAPASQGVRFASRDLRTGQPAPTTLSLAAPAAFTGQVVDADLVPVEGARLLATPTGLLARATRAGGSATSAADGTFSIEVAGTGDYQLRIDGPGGAGRVYLRQTAPTAGAATDLDMTEIPDTLRLGGTLTIAGGIDVVGALVQLQCFTCGPGGQPATVAEAVSDSSGDFVLIAPDPGVAE